MYLRIETSGRHFDHVSSAFTLTRTTSETAISEGVIECGSETLAAAALWYIFVKGHLISENPGRPSCFWIKLNPKETKIFQLLAKSGFWRKRTYFLGMLERKTSQRAALRWLEENLPIIILGNKLKKN